MSETESLSEKIARLEQEVALHHQAAVEKFNSRFFPLRQAVAASKVPEPTLRNWLNRRQLPLNAQEDREEGSWRLFSERDIVTIALAGRLYRLGVPVSQIQKIVGPMVSSYEGALGRVMNSAAGFPMFLVSRPGDSEDWAVEPMRPATDIPEAALLIDPWRIAQDALAPLGGRVIVGNAADIRRAADEMEGR